MKKVFQLYSFVSHHPLTKGNKISSLKRVIRFQIGAKINPYPVIYPLVDEAKLVVEKGMTGATGNIYAGLHEFEDMAFLLHFLREVDVFADIGANVGVYTILSAAVVKAKSVSVEPIPITFSRLERNIKVNNIERLVDLYNVGIGEVKGTLSFTKNLDTINHVAYPNFKQKDTINIPVDTIDNIFVSRSPSLIKIDVEGFELKVLMGAKKVLENPLLKAIIIELNGSGERYGIKDKDVHDFLLSYDFKPYNYIPFRRQIESKAYITGNANTIYIRDKNYVDERIKTARTYTVLGKTF